jgi:hypothetical protein
MLAGRRPAGIYSRSISALAAAGLRTFAPLMKKV